MIKLVYKRFRFGMGAFGSSLKIQSKHCILCCNSVGCLGWGGGGHQTNGKHSCLYQYRVMWHLIFFCRELSLSLARPNADRFEREGDQARLQTRSNRMDGDTTCQQVRPGHNGHHNGWRWESVVCCGWSWCQWVRIPATPSATRPRVRSGCKSV